ncbi:MAG: tetratricopeptide repeat protein [Candidatus Hodarchaeales archaeon]
MKRVLIVTAFIILTSCASTQQVQYNNCLKANQKTNTAYKIVTTDLQLAYEETKEAVRLCPTSENTALLGYIYGLNGQKEDAKKWADTSLRYSMSDPSKTSGILTLIGFTYQNIGEYDKSITYLGRALNHNPNNNMARNALGNIYLIQRELEKAELEYLKILNNDPNFAFANYNLGKLYMDEYLRYKESEGYLQRYIILDANNLQNKTYVDDAKKRLERLNELIKASDYQKEYEKQIPTPKAKELIY